MKRAWVALLLAACARSAGPTDTVEVKRADLVISVEVTGELEAVDSTDVNPPTVAGVWNYKIASLADEGTDVKEGEPLVAFDPSELMRQLETLQNDLEAAKKKLDKKRDDAALARRNEELEIAEAEANVRKASLKTTGAADLVASVEQKTIELDEQLAKLKLDDEEQSGPGGARRSSGDRAAIRSLQVPRRSRRRATSQRREDGNQSAARRDDCLSDELAR